MGNKKTTNVELTVVVPTYNEGTNVPLLVDQLCNALEGIDWEVIFVDDDSPDGTAHIVRAIGSTDGRVRCIRRIGRRGLSGACIEGMLAAQGKFIAVMDADLQHDETLLPKMLGYLREGTTDLVIGSRYVAHGSMRDLSKNRRLISKFAGRLAQWLTKTDVADPMSGFFMLRHEIADSVAPKLSNEGFKLLLDILTSVQTLRVIEIPYTFRKRISGTSKLDTKVVIDFFGLLTSRASRNIVPTRFVEFGLVGALGLIVHIIILKIALTIFELDFAAAQTGATIVAMTSNFYLNNILTYRDHRLVGSDLLKGLVIFYGICSVGALSNIGIAEWIYANRPVWWVAGLAGSLVGVVWNYVMSTELVWHLGAKS
jgi:dolichol-phosphate mannosyltransferase